MTIPITADIQQPARYLGNEFNSIHKPWDQAEVRWVLTFPEVYELGASNLGHIILYNIINVQPRQLCDRAYLPAPDMAQKLRDVHTPLFTVESRRSLTEFDILGFNLSYELGATNILEMLDLAGIPLTWQERQAAPKTQKLPLVFAGGQTATSNPEPYADFFDFIALGDGEELLPEIGLVIEEGKANNLSREELLLDLAQIPGVYVPQFYERTTSGAVIPTRPDVPERILRRVATPMPAYSIGLVPHLQTIHDRLVMEVRRGCTRGCRFCQPGMLTRPARDVEPEDVVNAIEKGVRATGYNEFSLLSLSCSDYLSLPAVGMEIKNRLKDENIFISLPSQRVDRFDENIALMLGGSRPSSLTFAPEAGTQRMRDIINKGLTDEELLRGVKTAYEQGWDKVKLYFMIGLPGETDEDVLGIAQTVAWLQQQCRGHKRRPLQVNLTISNFTPKPHTPFQWFSVSKVGLEEKRNLLHRAFRRMKGVKVNYTDVRMSVMEDFLGRGDRRLGPIIRRAWELGAGMDSWWENLDRAFEAWCCAIEENGFSPTDGENRWPEMEQWGVIFSESSSGNTKKMPELLEKFLPWDHINTGIDKNWLWEDWQRALEAVTVPDCSFEGCSHCGVCGPDLGHNVVIEPPAIPKFVGHFVPDATRVQKLRVWFGKLGEMALVGHLDLAKLFERAVRRAALPVSFSAGFHPAPRIMIASALPLGATSSGEIVDFELKEAIAPSEFQERLELQLPAEIPIYRAEELAMSSLVASRLLEKAEYFLQVGVVNSGLLPLSTKYESLWNSWVERVMDRESFWWDKTTKSGKVNAIDLRDRLFELEFVGYPNIATRDLVPIQGGFSLSTTKAASSIFPAGGENLQGKAVGEKLQFSSIAPDELGSRGQGIYPQEIGKNDLGVAIGSDIDVKMQGMLRYVGSYRNDGTVLQPKHIVYMLDRVSEFKLELLGVHRSGLFLKSEKR